MIFSCDMGTVSVKVNQWMGYDDCITKQELKKGVGMLICFVSQRVISTYENIFMER